MSAISGSSSTLKNKLLWAAVIVLGTVASGVVALSRGESINAAWLVIAAVCIYFVAYRFYGLYISRDVLRVDPARQTPSRDLVSQPGEKRVTGEPGLGRRNHPFAARELSTRTGGVWIEDNSGIGHGQGEAT